MSHYNDIERLIQMPIIISSTKESIKNPDTKVQNLVVSPKRFKFDS